MSNDRRSSGAAAEEMHVAADRPEEILAAAKHVVFVAIEHAAGDQFLGLADAIDVFGDPEQRVQIPQAAFAIFDVGLDEIARLTGAAMPLFALRQLGGDEICRGSLHHFFFETRVKFGVELGVAKQITRFQQRGTNGHIGFGLADALADRTRRVTDLLAHIPQAIEQRLGDRFSPRGLLVGQDKEQIDVGARCQQPAAITAGRDHRHALGRRARLRRIKRVGGKLEQDADDLILGLAQPLSATPPMTVFQQQFFGLRARLGERRFETAGDGGAQFAIAPGMGAGKGLEVGHDRRAVEEFGGGPRTALDVQHCATS